MNKTCFYLLSSLFEGSFSHALIKYLSVNARALWSRFRKLISRRYVSHRHFQTQRHYQWNLDTQKTPYLEITSIESWFGFFYYLANINKYFKLMKYFLCELSKIRSQFYHFMCLENKHHLFWHILCKCCVLGFEQTQSIQVVPIPRIFMLYTKYFSKNNV